MSKMRLYGGNPVQKFEIEVWEAEYIERSSFQLSTTWRFKSLLEFEQDLGKNQEYIYLRQS